MVHGTGLALVMQHSFVLVELTECVLDVLQMLGFDERQELPCIPTQVEQRFLERVVIPLGV